MQSIRGKIAFVTGATSGIGRATAMALAQAGCRLLLCSRRAELAKDVADSLVEAGAQGVLYLSLDVRDNRAVEAAFGSLPAEWLGVEILINNAGLSRGLSKIYEDDAVDWDEMIDTNVKGLLHVTRAVVPGMVQRKAGHVVNLGSTAGHMTYANGGVYCATKAAEKAISEGLRIDLMGTGVRVTSVDPGMVETNFSMVRFRGDEARAEKVYQSITPLQPEDVADAILWAVTRPAHVNVNTILMTPIDQANSVVFHRRDGGAGR